MSFKCSDLFFRQVLGKGALLLPPAPIVKMLSAAIHGALRTVSYAKKLQKGIFHVLHVYPKSFYFSPYVPQASASNSLRSGLA